MREEEKSLNNPFLEDFDGNWEGISEKFLISVVWSGGVCGRLFLPKQKKIHQNWKTYRSQPTKKTEVWDLIFFPLQVCCQHHVLYVSSYFLHIPSFEWSTDHRTNIVGIWKIRYPVSQMEGCIFFHCLSFWVRNVGWRERILIPYRLEFHSWKQTCACFPKKQPGWIWNCAIHKASEWCGDVSPFTFMT